MAQITLQINGKAYLVGCEDGQEPHLLELGASFDQLVRQIGADVGQIGETRLLLMGALVLADELSEARLRLAEAQAEAAKALADYARLELRAVTSLEGAAKKIEKMAAD